MILMYHNVVPADAPSGYRFQCITLSELVFARQIWLLRKTFRLLSLADYLRLSVSQRKSGKYASITFDDTTEITIECVWKLMKKGEFPVTFFVTSEQVDGGPLFWVAYLNAICHEQVFDELEHDGERYLLSGSDSRIKARDDLMSRALASKDPISYCAGLRDNYRVPERIMKYYRGISSEQLAAAGRCCWTEIAGHTVRHPVLPLLGAQEQRREIVENKEFLENKTGRSVRYLAYPFGDYDLRTIRVAQDAGFEAAFAVCLLYTSPSPRDRG